MASTAIKAREITGDRLFLKATGSLAFLFLMILSSQVRIPVPFSPIPMTLQTFFAPLAGAFLGTAWGSVSLIAYVGLGLLGLNVFATAQPGLGLLVAPSAGYIFGFVFSAWFMGIVRGATAHAGVLLAGLVLSHIAIFSFGVFGLVINAGVDLKTALMIGVVPFWLGDALKIIASFLVLVSYEHLRRKS